MKLTPQLALEEARKRYPEGTKYFWADSCYTVENNELFQIADYDNYWMIFSEPAKGVIYNSFTDTWAEIITTPKSLEDRLVDGFGFVKHSNGDGCKLKLGQIRIFIIPDLDGSNKVNLWLEDAFYLLQPQQHRSIHQGLFEVVLKSKTQHNDKRTET
jgi:hypothetical protein